MLKGLIAILLFSGQLYAGVMYKYTDKNGRTVYSDVAPHYTDKFETITSRDLPPVLITKPDKPQKKYVPKSTGKAVKIHSNESGACRYAKRMLEAVKTEIRTGKGKSTIEQLRDNKRKYTDLKYKNCK
ncbi:DUF4124 domain-containing protein [Zhongshania marina]